MAGDFGGKGARALKVAAGSGLGQVLGALVAAFFLRLVTGPGPELLVAPVEEEEGEDAQSKSEDPEAPAGAASAGGLTPVTIRWSNITCTLSDKRGKVVSS